MNELQPQQLDQLRFDQNQPLDTRKPLRQFIDDKLMPNLGMIAAPPLALAGALANIKRVPRLTNVG